MFARSAVRTLTSQSRLFSTTAARNTKVAVLGAGGGIGQPLSLLLKNDPLVTSLSLYDIRGAPGVAADVSHVDTASEVGGYAASELSEAERSARFKDMPPTSWMKPWRALRSLSFPLVSQERSVDYWLYHCHTLSHSLSCSLV